MTATDFWTAERGADTETWIDHYWTSWQAPYRQILVDLVQMIEPKKRVLEIGCHCGPNVRRLLTSNPDMHVIGVDCNAAAVNAGRTRLRARGLANRSTLLVGAFPDATQDWAPQSIDVAVTCYAAAYIAPDVLPTAIAELCRVARAVVMIEPNGTGQCIERGQYIEWRHEYEKALHAVVRGRRWWHYAIDPPDHGLDAVFVIGPVTQH